MLNSVKYYVVYFYSILFLFRKNYIFWFFLFSKKFIINHKKNRKTNNLNFETNYFQQKTKETNTT